MFWRTLVPSSARIKKSKKKIFSFRPQTSWNTKLIATASHLRRPQPSNESTNSLPSLRFFSILPCHLYLCVDVAIGIHPTGYPTKISFLRSYTEFNSPATLFTICIWRLCTHYIAPDVEIIINYCMNDPRPLRNMSQNQNIVACSHCLQLQSAQRTSSAVSRVPAARTLTATSVLLPKVI